MPVVETTSGPIEGRKKDGSLLFAGVPYAAAPSGERRFKAAVRNAFRVQMAGLGYSLVELVSNCPTNWGMTPLDSLKLVEEQMLQYLRGLREAA